MTALFKGKRRLAIAGLFLVLGGASLIIQKMHLAQAGDDHAAPMAQQAMPVKVTVAEKKPLRIWTSYSGRMVPVDFVLLKPQVDGRINEIKFEDGQLVHKDDILFVVDPRPYQAAVDTAQAAVNGAKSMHALALKDFERAKELINTNALPKKVFDERQKTVSTTKNAIEAAEAQLANAKVDLDQAYIKAPISGRISRPEITVGNVVESGPGAPTLTTIVSDQGIYADFEVDEQTYLQSIRHQAETLEEESKIPVKVTRGNEDKPYEGYIKSFDNHIDPSSGTIRARAFFDNEDGGLIPGMYVSVSMGSPATEDVILLTDQAISTDQDRKFVYVVGEGNKVAYREVQLGASVDEHHVITSGLAPGDKVIVDNIMKLRPDMVIEPIVEQPAPAAEPAVEPKEDKPKEALELLGPPPEQP